jgi:HNH endonuclease
MEVEHLFPRSLGGLTVEDNLWLTCSLCNEHKAIRVAGEDPQTGVLVRLFNPRHQSWQEHFMWIDSGTRILGKTSTGRATVQVLQLNRPSLVEAREIWVEAGWHPPED